MRIREAVCIAGSSRANEDMWGQSADTVWLMDGATGLSDMPLFPQAPSDPSWLVGAFDDFFHANAADFGADLAGLVAAGIAYVRQRFDNQRTREVAHSYELPVATLVMAHTGADTLTLLTLSDSYLITRYGNDVRLMGGDPMHEAIDAHTMQQLAKLRAQGVTDIQQARQMLLPTIRSGRMKANAPDGYPALGIEKGIEARLQVQTMPLPSGPLLLVSDGFSRLWDTFTAYSPATLLTAAQERGLEPLYAELRALENADADALKHPRLKKSDDATAVLVIL
ncbi:MAG: hypothetical protein GC134_08060 [Proteobacteria bacterium]|nr:hypothetical protein [Pseudomonadota bacterium]